MHKNDDVSGVVNVDIVADTCTNDAGNDQQSSINFDKKVFIEEVRKYRCLWDVNSEGYKMQPMKQNAWGQFAKIFNRDGEFMVKLYIKSRVVTIV